MLINNPGKTLNLPGIFLASIHENPYKQKVFERLNSMHNSKGFLNELNKINPEISGDIF